MTQRLSPTAVLLLTFSPLMWASNAVVGRVVAPLIPPMTLSLLRWLVACLILLPLAGQILRRDSPLWPEWRRMAWLSLLGVSGFNGLLYLALKTTTPINVSLLSATLPIWTLLVGRFFFRQSITVAQALGSALSIAGVVLVMCRGEWALLTRLHWVAGDVFILIAALLWAFYSWLLAHPTPGIAPVQSNWSAFLLGQFVFGLGWTSLFTALEWSLTDAHVQWSWPLLAAVLFFAVGPGILAFRAWGAGVARTGPAVAGFFANLIPLFTALLSLVFLDEAPQLFHLGAFALIVSGIVLSARR